MLSMTKVSIPRQHQQALPSPHTTRGPSAPHACLTPTTPIRGSLPVSPATFQGPQPFSSIRAHSCPIKKTILHPLLCCRLCAATPNTQSYCRCLMTHRTSSLAPIPQRLELNITRSLPLAPQNIPGPRPSLTCPRILH